MLTVAGVAVLKPQKEVLALIEKNIHPGEDPAWLKRAWPGTGLSGITVPTGYKPPPPFKVNQFRWPNGASNWASISVLADSVMTNQIALGAYGEAGDLNQEVVLEMDSPDQDGVTEFIRTGMYLLPPKPLSSVLPSIGEPTSKEDVISSNNLYLLTLVDVRYYWQYVNVGDLDVDLDTGMDWYELIDSITDKINTAYPCTFHEYTIDVRYLKASSSFILPYERAPAVLDAACYNCGLKVCRALDGEVWIQSFDEAKAALVQNFVDYPGRRIVAGGETFKDRVMYW